jgi:hypothetical protein
MSVVLMAPWGSRIRGSDIGIDRETVWRTIAKIRYNVQGRYPILSLKGNPSKFVFSVIGNYI